MDGWTQIGKLADIHIRIHSSRYTQLLLYMEDENRIKISSHLAKHIIVLKAFRF